jgi:hypothetical protein
MDWNSLISNLLTQSPLVGILGFMWWREATARDRLQDKLNATQEVTISTLSKVQNTLDNVLREVSR